MISFRIDLDNYLEITVEMSTATKTPVIKHSPSIPPVTDECDVCGDDVDSDSEEPLVLQRCSRCKNRFYCSSQCQKKDWKTHQQNCSLLPADLSPAIIERDAEHIAEIARVAGLLEQWMEAYKPFQNIEGWKANTLPESKLLAKLTLIPRYQYNRLDSDPANRKYAPVLRRICRLFLIDRVARISQDETKSAKFLAFFAGCQLPSDYPQLYGPKILAQPGNLSPGEYDMIMEVGPVWSMEERGSTSSEGPPDPVSKGWIHLSVASKKLSMYVTRTV